MIKLVADKATVRIIGMHFLADHTDTLTLIGIGVMNAQVAASFIPNPYYF